MPEAGPERPLLGGRYELGDPLGQGGMAEVRLGLDRRLGRPVAVKILRSDLATDPTFQARFQREARASAGLNHPAIVAVYDTGRGSVDDDSVPFIVMEYVDGRTLRDVLRGDRRLLPERALEISAAVLEALEYSHRAGIVHRDVKPGNVMLLPSGDIKVMDFGIARAVADASANLTQTATIIGTAHYLSPEQARGETVGPRSDIYSTGCLLYELLTGRPPFSGDSAVAVAYQHVREEPVPPSMVDAGVTPEADAICLKALRKKADDRYQSAEEMRADIGRALAGAPLLAPVTAPDATARVLGPDDAPTERAVPAVWSGPPDDDDGDSGRRKVRYLALGLAGVAVLAAVAYGGAALFDTETPGPGTEGGRVTEQSTPTPRTSASPSPTEEPEQPSAPVEEDETEEPSPTPDESRTPTPTPTKPSPTATSSPTETQEPTSSPSTPPSQSPTPRPTATTTPPDDEPDQGAVLAEPEQP